MYIGEGVTSKKFERRRSGPPWKWYLFGCAAICVALFVVVRVPYLSVTDVRVEGVTVERPKDVRDVVRSVLSGSYAWGLLPFSNVAFVPTGQITASVAAAFPRFSDVHVSHEGKNGLLVTVVERSPSYIACTVERECAYVDERGVMYAPSPVFSGHLFFEFVMPEVQGTTTRSRLIGTVVLPKEEWESSIRLKKIVDATLLETVFASSTSIRLHLLADGIRDMEVSGANDSDTTLKIRYTNDQPYEQLVSNIETSLLFLSDEIEKTKTRKTVEYVDMRFGNKVVYKYKE